MSKYGEDVAEPYAHGGLVQLSIRAGYAADAFATLSPDEARLLALRLIKMADEAEGQEW